MERETVIPVWLLRIGPYLGGGVLVAFVALWLYSVGERHERARWKAREAAAQAAIQEREDEMQAQVDAAGVALSEKQAQIDAAARAMSEKTKVYYVTNPAANVMCLSPERLRHIQESDAAYNSAKAAGSSPR